MTHEERALIEVRKLLGLPENCPMSHVYRRIKKMQDVIKVANQMQNAIADLDLVRDRFICRKEAPE